MSKAKVDYYDACELAASILKISGEDNDAIEEALNKKYDITSENYHKIIEDLFERLDFTISPLTQEAFVGFSENNKKVGKWLIKREVNQQFISGLIEWCSEGEHKTLKPGKGFVREITTELGKVEFEITIKRPALKEK